MLAMVINEANYQTAWVGNITPLRNHRAMTVPPTEDLAMLWASLGLAVVLSCDRFGIS
jgi:hypothetical protein